MTRALTILTPEALAALEAAGLTVVEREWLARLMRRLVTMPCDWAEPPKMTTRCQDGDSDACTPCRARWWIAKRRKGRG